MDVVINWHFRHSVDTPCLSLSVACGGAISRYNIVSQCCYSCVMKASNMHFRLFRCLHFEITSGKKTLKLGVIYICY